MSDLELLLSDIKTAGNLQDLRYPDIADYNFWRMYNNRILLLEDEIDMWDFHIVKDIINFNMEDKDIPVEEREPIIILINSCGGLLDVTLSICDIIRISETPVWTVNMGSALSGGCLIFLMGERRFTTQSSWCMCHAGSGGLQGNYSETKEQSKVWDAQVKMMGNIILEQSGIDEKIYKRNKNKDWWLDSKQQLEYNFATDEFTNIANVLWRG